MIVRVCQLCVLSFGLLVAVCVGYSLAAPGTSPRQASPSRANRDAPLHVRQRADLLKKYQLAMEEVAAASETSGQPDEAARIRKMIQETPSSQSALPRAVRGELPADLPPDDKFREAQIRRHQSELAKGLYLLSRQTLTAGMPSLAYDLVRETALYDPDHPVARRILGFVRSENEWVTPFEAEMKRAKKVWTPRFGWLPSAHEDRYAKGERFYRNQWMSTAKETEIRRDFRYAWEIRTEHFKVLTNHSLERGVELATKLEDFHGVCTQTLSGFFQSPEQLRLLFEGKNQKKTVSGPLEVNYYRTHEEYLKVIKGLTQQEVEMTKGIFFPNLARAYFYDDPENDDDSTLYHEATHLLLSGNKPQAKPLGMRSDFWIIEGIACYMESFRRDGETASLGDPTQIRMRAAQHHLVTDQYYVPLRDFSAMGMQAFQTDKNIRKNYSQSAALAHFFIHYEDGKYRDALVQYLTQIYSSRSAIRDFPQSMEELTTVRAAELDAEYKEYLTGLNTVTEEAEEAP